MGRVSDRGRDKKLREMMSDSGEEDLSEDQTEVKQTVKTKVTTGGTIGTAHWGIKMSRLMTKSTKWHVYPALK